MRFHPEVKEGLLTCMGNIDEFLVELQLYYSNTHAGARQHCESLFTPKDSPTEGYFQR